MTTERKAYSFRLDPADVDRWDQHAEQHGINRTQLIEQAVDMLLNPPTSTTTMPTRARSVPLGRFGVRTSAEAKAGVQPITPAKDIK